MNSLSFPVLSRRQRTYMDAVASDMMVDDDDSIAAGGNMMMMMMSGGRSMNMTNSMVTIDDVDVHDGVAIASGDSSDCRPM